MSMILANVIAFNDKLILSHPAIPSNSFHQLQSSAMASTTVCAHVSLPSAAVAIDSLRQSRSSSTTATVSLALDGGARRYDATPRQQRCGKQLRHVQGTDFMGAAPVCGMRRSAGRSGGLRIGSVRASAGNGNVGENPDWSDEDYLVVGLAHCFVKGDDQKLSDAFVVEPIPAGGLECMDNGGVTCYKHATGTNLGTALKQDLSLLPGEFGQATFCEDFNFRAKCASRTWKRDHPQEKLLNLVPRDGTVRSDFNFSVRDKRVLNQEHIVKDSDNIKQDMSIDVYGRTEEEQEMTSEIGQLYNA